MLREILPPDTALAYPAMRELRPNLDNVDGFTQQVDVVQRPSGYRLIGVFDDVAPNALSVAGFRAGTNLAWGAHLYVDDLSTLPVARGRGLARQLLDWVHAEAVRLGCGQIHLDSGVGPDRDAAHRLYLNAGYRIASHHFARSA